MEGRLGTFCGPDEAPFRRCHSTVWDAPFTGTFAQSALLNGDLSAIGWVQWPWLAFKQVP